MTQRAFLFVLGFTLLRSANAASLSAFASPIKRWHSVDLANYALSVTSLFDNAGVGTFPGEATFAQSVDNSSDSYVASFFPNSSFYSQGVTFSLPHKYGGGKPDNLICDSQNISLSQFGAQTGRYFSVHLLGSADGDSAGAGNLTLQYADGSSDVVEAVLNQWRAKIYHDRRICAELFGNTQVDVAKHPERSRLWQIQVHKYVSSLDTCISERRLASSLT